MSSHSQASPRFSTLSRAHASLLNTFSLFKVSSLLICTFCSCHHHHLVDTQMQSLDKQLVFYVNVVSVVVFALIMLYFFITTKPKDAVD